MFNKFDFIWSKLEIKDKSIEKACADKLKKISWMIYLYGKETVFGEQSSLISAPSLPEYAFLIVAVLHLVITNSNHSTTLFGQSDIEIGLV